MSRRILSYGEDPLTLWVMQSRLEDFLGQLGDSSDPSKALVLYRPSFGRGGRNRPGSKPSASFGEFDAIVATREYVYPVESKWDGSPELRDDELVIKPGQIMRHQILGWYRQSWAAKRPASWVAFEREAAPAFEAEFPNNRLAPAGSRLASNLEFVLRILSEFPSESRDVALYCSNSASELPLPVRCVPGSFNLVTIQYEPVDAETSYFILSSARSEWGRAS